GRSFAKTAARARPGCSFAKTAACPAPKGAVSPKLRPAAAAVQDVTRSSTVSRPFDPLIVGVLAVAVLGVGTSGPLIAYAAAPALAIAFWRTALALGVLGPA